MKPVALLVGACLLLLGFIAMGPIGWLVVGTLLAVGVIQVHRKRARETDRTHTETGYCPDCGATIELESASGDGEGGDRVVPSVRYCPNCGESIDSEGDTENAADSSAPGQTGTTNCAACGAPNEPDRTTCKHCDAALS
ncbi:hypothetical protein [Natrinema versiforme]|uniref:DZANK-type domain-containing protein n=1 Tax=Natrinema versiforme JCM 10478 TaxID=1227496 RepID=L9Y347_9EURY|nr:hypothetical protein [Natrinema versiforme]ELY68132.1 hypothetical protein C489_09020 [Natrinema versiforme JCM 10478]